MEVESAVRRFLLTPEALRSFWVDKVYKYRLEEPIEGTGGMAAVVSRAAGWTSPDPRKTAEYPVVWVDVYADPTRTFNGEIQSLDAEDKALGAARMLKRLMHGQRGVWWGAFGSNPGLMVVSCAQWQVPEIIRAGDRHASEPRLGDTVIVRTRWALQIASSD